MSTTYNYAKLDQPEVLKQLFSPKASSSQVPDHCEDMMISTDDDAQLHLRAFPSELKDKAVILYFHDGNEDVGDYTDIAAQFIKNMGTSVLVAEYRGFGLATGTSTTSNMMSDCQLLFDRALQWKKDNNFTGKFACMGRGIGCAPAIEVVHQNSKDTDALFIDSGFTFTLPVLEKLGIDVKALEISENDCFHNLEKIQEISQALYVIHMAQDEFIPMDNPSNLVPESLSKQKELQLVPGKADEGQTILDVTGNMYFEVMNRFTKLIGILRKKKVGVR